jgi:hypothetical protein
MAGPDCVPQRLQQLDVETRLALRHEPVKRRRDVLDEARLKTRPMAHKALGQRELSKVVGQ